MGSTLPERPKWLERALQGLAFWIGHRHSLFDAYPLTEGAFVAEACSLIQANLPSGLVLLPERMYKNLVPLGSTKNESFGLSRADLVLCAKPAKRLAPNSNIAPYVKFVIEVKRGSATRKEVNADLARLHKCLQASRNDVRAFLFVVSESRPPSRFVKLGKSVLGLQTIPGRDGYFRVRRTVKAAAKFHGRHKAHYVCLIEVFQYRHNKSLLI